MTLLKKFKKIIDKSDNIKFPGYISNRKLLIETYDNHNILVLPSFTEGQPYVVDEALARKRPVLIFEDIADIIKGRKGIFVSKRNVNTYFRNEGPLANCCVRKAFLWSDRRRANH